MLADISACLTKYRRAGVGVGVDGAKALGQQKEPQGCQRQHWGQAVTRHQFECIGHVLFVIASHLGFLLPRKRTTTSLGGTGSHTVRRIVHVFFQLMSLFNP